jgi:translation initiation factor IF-2
MTSGGKVRIYELSRDLGLDNRDVLDAAEKLSIAAKSHSSSISDSEAVKIRSLLQAKGGSAPARAPEAPGVKILTVKKAAPAAAPTVVTPPVTPPAPPGPQRPPRPQLRPSPPPPLRSRRLQWRPQR